MLCSTIVPFLSFCASALASHVPHSRRHLTSYDPKQPVGMRTVGYYGNWDIYARNFTVQDIKASQFTHLIYSFANVNSETGEVYLSDLNADVEKLYPGDVPRYGETDLFGNLKQLYLLKKNNRSLKTSLAIGGWTYSPNFPPVLRSAELRANFVSSAVTLMTDLGFDGLDIDYEYVTDPIEGANMVLLLSELRTAMDALSYNDTSPFLLSYASPAGPDKYKQLDLPAMDQYLDFWNFMGYDYAGGWDTVSGHMANVFPDGYHPLSTPFSTATGIDDYTSSGVPASKINLGMPLYVRSFANTEGPGRPFNGTGTDSSWGEPGIWDIKALPVPGYNMDVVDLVDIGAAYAYDRSKRYMMSYDTPVIANIKAQYIQSRGLGGGMWWEVSGDASGDASLVGTVVKQFVNLDQTPNHLSYPTSKYLNVRQGMLAY